MQDFNIGDSVLHHPTSTYFEVVKRAKSKKTGEVTLKDAVGNPYLAAECIPDHRNCPLNAPESSATTHTALDTLLAVIGAMIESGDFSDLELLETLTQEQKRQLWGALSVEQRQILKAAREVAA